MNLCYEIASRLYKRKNKINNISNDVNQSSNNYWKWQFESSNAYFLKFFDFYDQIHGKSILDLGCGLGGRTSFLATKNLTRIVGIDINHDEINQAKDIAKKNLDQETLSKIQFISVDEDEDPKLGLFDVVLLVDSLEHVKDPVNILNLAYRFLKPGGICYFATVGWYHHDAAHMRGVIPVPFITLFFSDRSIFDAVRRIVSSPYYFAGPWDSNPPILRYENIQDLHDRPGEYLNKITIQKIRSAVKLSSFQTGDIRVIGFSWEKLPLLKCFNFLSKIPVIQEAYHSCCLGRLVRK